MKSLLLTRFVVITVSIAALVVAGCGGGATSRVKPETVASDAGTKAVELYDANGDGALAGAELDKAPGLKSAMARLDADHDGRITADEISARIQAWKKSPLGRIDLSVSVTRNGQPLPDATVTFVPESFLGDKLSTAAGKTNQYGQAVISVLGGDPPGLSPGFYRVQITRAGESIPDVYNTATVLGQEVGADVDMTGITFDLRY
jgi:hypothetical protein